MKAVAGEAKVMTRPLRILFLMASMVGTQAHAASVDAELNKLEAHDGSCRVQMVVTNSTKTAYTGFGLDLVIFDKENQIARRTVLDVAPVRASKTSVYTFDLKDLKCDVVGSILLNDVLDCAQASGAIANCVDEVNTKSRAKVPFKK